MYTCWIAVSARRPWLMGCCHNHQKPLLILHHNASICSPSTLCIQKHMLTDWAKRLCEEDVRHVEQKTIFLAH